MFKAKTYFLFFILFTLSSVLNAQLYVTVKSKQFYLNNAPYYYIGTNYWYGSYLAVGRNKAAGLQRLRRELDFLKAHGVNNLRVLTGVEGTGQIHGIQRAKPPLQPKKGIFNLQQLEGLDVLLSEMSKRNMKAVLFLSNNWEWSGGFLQYLNWNGLIEDSVLSRRLSWDEQRDYTSRFYSCNSCVTDYLKQVKLIVSRTNKVNGRKFSADPTIVAWELANEPRPMRPAANEAYVNWINKTSTYIKSLDKNHLVTLGHEGDMATDQDMNLYEKVHANKNVDYLTIHIWPKNWGWFKEETMQEDMPKVIENSMAYLDKHVTVANRLQKPLVIEEFGLPRDGHSFDISAATSLRDDYYSKMFARWQKHKETNEVIGGVNFWAFGGSARPKSGQIFWKDGDDYMGDPPMEEQGLNTVFNSDSSTWQLIKTYTKNVGSSTSAAADLPIDKNATKETVNLHRNLKRLLNKGIMFGHQDALAYGVGWKYVPGKSDVKEVIGDYPAVYGWEIGRLEMDNPVNIDSVPFDSIRNYIRATYNRGGIATLSWHLNNPLTGKTAWDPAPGTVASILPGAGKYELYKSWLDKVAAFVTSFRSSNGQLIPIIFRPFHELNGNWFWWGKDHCTPEEYKQLYQFTVKYLRDTKQVHNLLYAFNTDQFQSQEEYLQKYPGDDWVDVIGFDIYQRKHGVEANEQFARNTDRMLTDLEVMAQQRGKIPALTEFGYPEIADSTWWTNSLWKALKSHKISYALGWRNAGPKPSGENEYYVPYKGQVSEQDFIKFYQLGKTLFQKDITKEKLYQE